MGLKILGKMGIIAIKQDVMRIKLCDAAVTYRIGSLENSAHTGKSIMIVTYRIGSLEIFLLHAKRSHKVTYRIGSLEITLMSRTTHTLVTYRIGSLETLKVIKDRLSVCYLPHR